MTKLVVVLAVVIVVILVIVIIAARSMRAEDPDEFADRPGDRGMSRGGRAGQDDDGYERHPQRRARSAGSAQRSRGYDQRMQDRRTYEADGGFDRGPGPGYSERRGPQPARDERARGSARRGNGSAPRRPEESPAPARARQARSRRSSDSSEWDSSEWEKLSDVDYWAELASDKPLTTTAQPAASQARSGPDRDSQAPARRPAAQAPPPRRDPATGLPVRGRPQPAEADLTVATPGRADFTPAPLPVTGPGHAPSAGRPRVDPDDDPLTSPSFPRIPAADSRSYRNGRADTPPRGSRAPAPYPASTQQFASYGSLPAADYSSNGGRDTDTTHPNAYDPLSSGNPYPAPASPPPTRPVPAAPASAGNPYGSYVTPDSQATVAGYREYSGAHSRADRGSYPPPARPGEVARPSGNGYWHHQPPVPGGTPAAEAPGYLDGQGQYPDPLGAGSPRAGYGSYGNGYAAAEPPGYLPGSYPAGPQDPAGYAPLDPYGRDGYGGYPGSGAAGR